MLSVVNLSGGSKMIDLGNEDQVKKAYEAVKAVVGDFYSSTEYVDWEKRYKNRIEAYYCRNNSKLPQWRSKLYLPTFFLGCKALDAQFKAAHNSDPFIWVSVADDSQRNPEAIQLAKIAQADLNYDLQISDFIEKKCDMDWYTELCGVAVGREYVRIYQESKTLRRPAVDAYGFDAGTVEQQMIQRKEMTCTQVIHPLNFAHKVNVRNFKTSEWGSTRFPLHISEIYKMRGHPDYYQPGVEKILKEIEAGMHGGYTTGSDSYYEERGTDGEGRKRFLIADEYFGPIWFRGNEGDFTFYHALYCKQYNCFLRIGPSPFDRIPYWKMQTYPDPDGPFGVGPNDMLRPINNWENSTVNQYVDYMNSALKFMYKINPAYVMGGQNALINGLPFGILAMEKGGNFNEMIDVVNRNAASIPPVGDVIQLIQKLKQEVGPSSNLRGKESNQLNDTATGISLMAQREDAVTAAIQQGCDQGIQDGMSLKMQHYMKFFTEPKVANVGDKRVEIIKHYPYELAWGGEFSFKIRRKLADVEAGKYMNYIRMVDGLDKLLTARGTPLPAEFLIDGYEDLGKALTIDGIEGRFEKLRASLVQPPSPAGLTSGTNGGAPAAPAAPSLPEPAPAGAGMAQNAMAMA
jgi:hypothetical protein